jgi:hypothetical protein
MHSKACVIDWKGKTNMMKGQLSLSTMGLILAAAALSFYAVRHLPAYLFREAAPVALTEPLPAQQNRIYCETGPRKQYSNVHHGWVCPTQLTPDATN